ncbi:asparagine synthetase B family protein [Brevundimonas aveniformis]|uniref:asparagine synthetase B family protein n=1 Tax=Brevundimonas aveniformis TaxID=370977 RepID=UPI0004111173|nr:asparagine synthase-related protein [Brevundimonas aveniformis]
MCGIAGILGADQAPEAAVRQMIDTLQHRGPDGIRIESGPGWCLAHARLSIIDLEGGWQPLHAGGSTVIGNGEIYNYVELIEEFGLQDKLTTGSDFEPLLHLYNLEGEKAFTRLRGMYAFCLIGADGRTWLVRDPFGIKPLYLSRKGDDVAFASEPRGLTPRIVPTPAAAGEVLSLGYRVSPLEEPVIDMVPGEVRQVTRDPPPLAGEGDPEGVEGAGPGAVRAAAPSTGLGIALRSEFYRRSGSPSASRGGPPPPSAMGEGQLLARLDAVLEDSVRVHQRSDVPYGLFLSGGIDSSAIATLMARLNERPVTAFTCGFDAPGARDERAHAEAVAVALNLDWRETTFGEEDFWRILPEVAWALDDPTTDYATLPTWKLAEAAKGTLTVVLSGEGGDELFGGYGRYRRALRPRWLGGRPAEPQFDAHFLNDGGKAALESWRLAAGQAVQPWMTPLQRAQAADIATWLPNDLLLKLDRTLMAHGLEGRTPFLDREVAAFAFNLPDRFKVRGRYGKYLPRKWLERHLPAADPWAKKKGFTVPVAAWIAPRARDLAPALAAHEGLAQVCNMDAVRAVFERDDQPSGRWPLLFYAVWWNIHVAGMERKEALAALLPSP